MACVYRISSPTGKSYIGATRKSAKGRYREHVRSANRGSCNKIHRAIRKYGPENMKVETLVIGDIDYCFELEQKAIKGFGTLAPSGYNLTSGGQGITGLADHVIRARAQSLKNTLAPLEKREEISRRVRKQYQNPEYKKAHANGVAKFFAENREKMRDHVMTHIHNNPEVSKKRLKSVAEAMKRSECRRKKSESVKKAKGTLEARAQAAIKTAERWDRPGEKEKLKDAFERRRKDGLLSKNYIYRTKAGTYSVKIRHGGKNLHLGTLKTYHEAVKARDEFLESVGRL